MKKTVKYISALIASALVVLSLCSCEKIDSMRERQILRNTAGDELFYKGSTYKFALQDKNSSYDLISSVYEIVDMYHEKTMRITDADVPVLLTERLGTVASISVNSDIIKDKSRDIIYVKSNVFDKYNEYLKNISFDHYFIYTSQYTPQNGRTKVLPKLFPEDLTNEIADILSHPEKYPECTEKTMYGSTGILKCDAEMLFASEAADVQILFLPDDAFAIEVYDSEKEEYIDVMLPEKYFPALKELLEDDYNYRWAIDQSLPD